MTSAAPSEPILIVEDDKRTSDLLAHYFAREGFATVAAFNGTDALRLATLHNPLLLILDVMLPDMDGWDVCRRLRTTSAVPILILSALGEAHDKVKGLTLGADDFVVKPFSFQELVARVKAILRRRPLQEVEKTLTHEGLAVDLTRHRVSLNDAPVEVTSSELRLLEALIAAPGRVFARGELLRYLYPHGGVVIDRVIDVHIAKLRQKIEDDPANPRHILTARGLGYRFADLAP